MKKGFEKCYNLELDWGVSRTAYCVSAGRLRYYLLLTAIHRLLARLFTIIYIYSQPQAISTAMIQLKPGIAPASLRKLRKSPEHRKNRSAKKKNAGLHFERVFSEAAISPFDQVEWERRTAEITDD